MVYADADWDQGFDAGEEVVLRHEALDSDITIVTAGVTGGPNSLVDGYLMFNGSGYPRLKNGSFTNGRIELKNTARSRTVIFDSAGRVRSCVTGSTGC